MNGKNLMTTETYTLLQKETVLPLSSVFTVREKEF